MQNEKPLSPERCRQIIAKYPDDLELWDKFFSYMLIKDQEGASTEYCLESFKTLETVWESQRGENENATT